MSERQPSESNSGVPLCSYEACQQYDGKRCHETGMRAGGICEPEVIDIVSQLRTARARLAEVEPVVEAAKAWHATIVEQATISTAPWLGEGPGALAHIFEAVDALTTKGRP